MDNIRITIDTNAADAAKTFEQLSKSFDDSTKSSEDLRKQIKGLKDELYKLTPGTEEYGRVLQDLGGKMDQLSDTSQELRVATGGLDAVFQSTTNATATMAAGFTAVTGVVSLFGGESEDLQKTFVKLQAVMAIMTGLKGFAGFAKITKQASTSLKAYIAQMTLARKATMQQTSATTTLATTETIATGATKGLAVGFKSLTAAIASNPIGALLVVLTSAIALITKFNDKQKEAAEMTEKYNEAVGKTPPPVKNADEQLEDYLNTLDAYDQRLQAIGVTEERRSEIKREQLEKEVAAGKELLKELEEEIEAREKVYKTYDAWTAVVISTTENLTKHRRALKDVKQEAIDTANGVKKLEEELEKLANKQLPTSMQELNSSLSSLSDEFRVKIAGGLATQGDYLQAQIKVYQDAYNDLWEIVGGGGTHPSRKIKGAGTEEGNLNKELATKYQAQIKGLEVELDVYNAGIAKKNRDAAQKLAEQLEKNYDELINNVSNEAKDIVKKWNEVLGSLDFNTFTLISPEERSGRLSAQTMRFEAEIDNYLNTWRELAKKAKLSEDQMKEFNTSLDNIKQDLIDNLNIKFNEKEISESVKEAGQAIQNSIADIKLDNENMLKALSAGLISKQEYQEWVVKAMQEYKTITDQVVETNNPFEEAFIQASKAIISLEVESQMQSEVKTYYDNIIKEIDKGFEKLEKEYEFRSNSLQTWIEDQNRSWLEGGTNTSYWGDSASTTFKKAQEQADELYKLLHEEYTQEAAMLQEKMQALDENSEAYAQYYAKLNELRDADAAAQAAHETASLANARQYGQDVMEMAGKFGDAISGLAGAMSSYYAEQAEQAKEMYGENSEEYKKYLKKEGNMKIAQVWTDAATGIMTAWATSEQLGPIAGPILAAVQTAALLATAVASTQQIKRQTQANASGGASTANVSGITDRVIFGEAQNADQQAQLNGQYSAGDQRVYVVEGDINNAQRSTRTAVTNNSF